MIAKFVFSPGCIILLLWSSALADSVDARCDLYPLGEDHASATVACIFSQRQGFVTISLDNGVVYELHPSGDSPGNYLDEHGQPAFRQSGLGADGLVFRLQEESIYVYWSTTGLPGEGPVDPQQPYSTKSFDATTQFRCYTDSAAVQLCAAGVARMGDGQASITITGITGEEFTINFMSDYVNSAGHQIDTSFDGDTWMVVVDATEYYEIPRAAIEGG